MRQPAGLKTGVIGQVPPSLRRVAVIGCSCSGKTTFARRLANASWIEIHRAGRGPLAARLGGAGRRRIPGDHDRGGKRRPMGDRRELQPGPGHHLGPGYRGSLAELLLPLGLVPCPHQDRRPEPHQADSVVGQQGVAEEGAFEQGLDPVCGCSRLTTLEESGTGQYSTRRNTATSSTLNSTSPVTLIGF